MAWQDVAREAQASVMNSIPQKWKLAATDTQITDLTAIPSTCGILSAEQLKITEMTATSLIEHMHSGILKSVQVTEAFCARAAVAHQLCNCLTAFFTDEALATAKELDDRLQETGKPVGPLHGLPVSIKDTYDLAGYATTFGYMANKDQIATTDSTLVKVLRDAGAVFYVKTTMPQTGMALETDSPLWGRTVNPFNTKLTPGGSSGGEAALIALRGSPIGPATDIGGSIRAPAAFSGLYAIRPTSWRIPLSGMRSSATGQISIRVSCGPMCHSMADLKMFTEVINAHPRAPHDYSSIPIRWRNVKKPTGKLAFGLWRYDGVVMPQPPILRALEETAAKLRSAGHEVIEFRAPFDCWEAAKTTFKLFFQSGTEKSEALIASAGEPTLPAYAKIVERYDVKEQLSGTEVMKYHAEQIQYKAQFQEAWSRTIEETSTGRAIDGLICPVSASASFPHEFPAWVGYTVLFSLLDYPSTVLPLKKFKVDAKTDAKDLSYQPRSSPQWDKDTYDMYAPELFENMPITLQVVGRPFEDEELISVTEVLDDLMNYVP